jgi:cytochrome b561
MSGVSASKYNGVAMTLHWLIAFAIAGLIAGGWWAGDILHSDRPPAEKLAAYDLLQVHKSIGLSVLVLSVFRLVWRLINPPPAPPIGMPGWQRAASGLVHLLFYGVMIATPLLGWAYVSSGWSAPAERFFQVPTLWFKLFEVPHIPLIADAGEEARKSIGNVAYFLHSKMAWVAIGLLVLHVGAALKHHIVDRDDVLSRMVPFLRAPSR